MINTNFAGFDAMGLHDEKAAKRNEAVRSGIVSFGIAACALTASSKAQAETIFLICPNAPYGDVVSVDLTKRTVNDYPATINATGIMWRHPERCANCTPDNPAEVIQSYYIDRTTGILKVYDHFSYRDGTQNRSGPFTHTCKLGKAPRTKF